MEVKKNDRANLEKRKSVFFQVGLIITLSLILIAFEWTSKPSNENSLGDLEDMDIEEEIVPITRQQQKPPPPPPPPPSQITELEIVEDDVELDDELVIEDIEADQNMAIEITEFEQEEEAEEETVFIIVEDMPTFNGKEASIGFREYIGKTLNYPDIASENGIEGRVIVQFAVNSRGQVVNARVVRGVDPALDKEALRVVNSSPKWSPGKQRGKPVSVQFTFPINFVLQ